MNLGLIAVIIMLLVIIGAVVTKRCTAALFIGSLVGAIFLYGKDFVVKWVEKLMEVVADNAWLWLVCGLFGVLIALLKISKGTLGFATLIEKICKTERSSLLITYLMGILIFIDDYLNVMTVGVCMKDLYDKRKIPRETLAFLLDSTGAPVCVLLPFSSWAAFYAMLFYEHNEISSQFASPMKAYAAAIPFMFYPIIVLIIVLLFCLNKFPKLGAMKRAYKRVEETGMVYSELSRKYNHETVKTGNEKGNLLDFMVPMAFLIAVCIITGEVLNGLVVSIIVAAIMYLARKKLKADEFSEACTNGFAEMLNMFFLLVACFTMQAITTEMGMINFISDGIAPIMTAQLLPMIAFIIIAILAFATGSDWGMSAIAIPVFIPIAVTLGANIILTMAAIVSAGTFGAHACFYADATVLASKSACINNLEHALSQLPYVLIAAGLAVTGFCICGFVMA